MHGSWGVCTTFMRWRRPILTDSGGYQVFSLAEIRRIHDDGVEFQSHIDGTRHAFTPESVTEIQRTLGADVMMAFDECPPGGCDRATAEGGEPSARSRWLERCRKPASTSSSARAATCPTRRSFRCLQGNVFDDLRRDHARQRSGSSADWRGFGIGGLSVGEAKEDMWRTLELLDE